MSKVLRIMNPPEFRDRHPLDDPEREPPPLDPIELDVTAFSFTERRPGGTLVIELPSGTNHAQLSDTQARNGSISLQLVDGSDSYAGEFNLSLVESGRAWLDTSGDFPKTRASESVSEIKDRQEKARIERNKRKTANRS